MQFISRTYTNTKVLRNGRMVRKAVMHIILKCPYCNSVVERRGTASIKAKSCGCMRVQFATTHGMATAHNKHHLYSIWVGMLNRCRNRKMASWPRYGGRGIKVCKRWKKFIPFYRWAVKHGWRYYPKGSKRRLCIDRINNDADYKPSNCRFVTFTESNRHKASLKLNMEKADMIRDMLAAGWSRKRIAQHMRVGWHIVTAIALKRSWNK